MTDKELIKVAFHAISRLYMNQRALADFALRDDLTEEQFNERHNNLVEHLKEVQIILLDKTILKALK